MFRSAFSVKLAATLYDNVSFVDFITYLHWLTLTLRPIKNYMSQYNHESIFQTTFM